MASFNINSTVTTTQTLNGEIGLLGQNGSIQVISGNAINATGNSDVVINGTVATNFNGLNASGSSLELVVGSLGNILTTGSFGVFANASNSAEVFNNGSISSTGTGIGLYSSDASVSFFIFNSGVVSGLYGVLVEPAGATSTIINNGMISGSYTGISAGFSSDTVLEVWNSGTISGGDHSFLGSVGLGSSDRIYNSGLMDGDIQFNGGDDIYKGRLGFVSGDIVGDDGDDILKGGAGAEVLYGGDDDDILSGW
ncbi:MAG: hypothetical protein GY947_08945, partial [Rhodobacteraceae bacterium]|nr:hypothetical protein [Paracoccaceae bacterium]